MSRQEFDLKTFLEDRRDRKVHSKSEIFEFCRLAGSGQIQDYQISAWLMAAYLNPLSENETVNLTLAMAQSGDQLNLSALPKPLVDKHSTGGVGDKTTIVLLPILASCGMTMVKMSGRGLGITGGTLDKLSSVPGFRLNLTAEEMISQASKIGIVLTGQSQQLVPADKVFYSLRGSTETVDSLPLIIGSILSKKIAGGCEFISLDVKCGSGSFMATLPQAIKLKNALLKVGTACNLKLIAHISDADQPLGECVGNAIEVNEAISILKNEKLSRTSSRARELCVTTARDTLRFVNPTLTLAEASAKVGNAITSGLAYKKLEEWFSAQGATQFSAPLDKMVELEVKSSKKGFLAKLDAGIIGKACINLGGGRANKADQVDLQVGVKIHALVGDFVEKDQEIATILSRSNSAGEQATKLIQTGIKINDDRVEKFPLFLDTS